MATLKGWSSADSLELYGVPGWSEGYFGINGKGNAAAYPSRNSSVSIDLKELVEDAQSRGLSLPLLIRFSDILADRLAQLRGCFAHAITQESYEGAYINVYPVKVNPQRQVVDEILRFGHGHPIGLEAGSKPELHLVLAMLDAPDQIVVCNGYKDAAYIRLALQAQKLGKSVYLVAEKRSEIDKIIEVAGEEAVRPLVGIRVRLSKAGSGKWEDSGGDHSKFGLTPWELVDAVERLSQAGMQDTFRLLHVHLGSQINNIRNIKDALREMSRYYAELRRLGCPIDHVDVGGGLGVDYNGSRSTAGFSINYDVQEYANDVIGALAAVCAQHELPHPNVITEAGRAVTAHHAMLALNVLETASLAPARRLQAEAMDEENDPAPLVRLEAINARLSARNLAESWHDAQDCRDQVMQLFELGYFTLHQRARADRLYWAVAYRVRRLMERAGQQTEDMSRLDRQLAERYFCNFSVFQSLPDSWAIGQEFPVMPLHHLHERPTRNAVLQDITCDSDGKIERFIGATGAEGTLPLHGVQPGEPYYLGVFMTGAYQEILGDMHNLFGDTNVIHVTFNEDGTWRYEEVIHGESVVDVLAYVQFNGDTLVDRVSRTVRDSVRAGHISAAEGKTFVNLYQEGLRGTTFLEPATPRKGRRKAKSSALVG